VSVVATIVLPVSTHLHVGRAGEEAAERLYVRRGYRVLARNWRCRIGELDLVLQRGGTLVICEVKARRGSRFGRGFEAVDARKQQKLRAVAQVYLQQVFPQRSGVPLTQIRFDVASVRMDADGSASIEVFEDAF